MADRLDFVIFGATGFTGKHTVEELCRICKDYPDITWGIAGRSESKLKCVLKEVQHKTGTDLSGISVIVADLGKAKSLTDMTRQARVILNCCGPYKFYGEAVIKACIETFTHHLDVSGEPLFIEEMQLKYHDAAKDAGIYIVSACAFDSIPCDMGVVYLQQQFKGQVNSVETFLHMMIPFSHLNPLQASIHYGTWESLVYATSELKPLKKLREKLYPHDLPLLLPRMPSRRVLHQNEIDGWWYLPFFSTDNTIVYRTQRYFYDVENRRPVQMKSYFGLPNMFLLLALALFVFFIAALSQFSLTRKLLLRYPRIFSLGYVSHKGPSEERMKETKFHFYIRGEGWDECVKDVNGKATNKTMVVKVSGSNPAYGATCTALIFSAIAVLKEYSKMPGNGGVLTTGAAFSQTSLIENLTKNNLTYEVITPIEDRKRE